MISKNTYIKRMGYDWVTCDPNARGDKTRIAIIESDTTARVALISNQEFNEIGGLIAKQIGRTLYIPEVKDLAALLVDSKESDVYKKVGSSWVKQGTTAPPIINSLDSIPTFFWKKSKVKSQATYDWDDEEWAYQAGHEHVFIETHGNQKRVVILNPDGSGKAATISEQEFDSFARDRGIWHYGDGSYSKQLDALSELIDSSPAKEALEAGSASLQKESRKPKEHKARPFVNYHEYMESDEWKAVRGKRMKLDRFQCTMCGTAKNLTVHHITYERLGREDMDDLITLCKDCHAKVHENDLAKKGESK